MKQNKYQQDALVGGHNCAAPELLSPAGSFQTLKAVTNAGADAVYAAGSRFGARAYASNFTDTELLEAIEYMHIRDKRFYLTVNTLLKEPELETELYSFLEPLYRQGLDGVIVQDLGVLGFLRRNFPEMELHASTQMAIMGVAGARLMKNLGLSRIVTARELSLSEISEIHKNVDIEIESFIHGALCYCYSGQCLLSSMLGGRSGNRGRCAQPCRLPYQHQTAKELHQSSSPAYLLSLKDLCTIELLPQILASGVSSLKIEGRMKQAEYAAGVTAIYRNYLDQCLDGTAVEYRVSEADLNKLAQLGSRSGFTKGYYLAANGSKMMTFERPAHTKANEELHEQIREQYLNDAIKEKINGILILSKKLPAKLVLKCKGISVEVFGDEVQTAQKKPLDQNTVAEKIKKTGASQFEFQTLEIQMEEDVFLPVSSLNQLRRTGIEQLAKVLTEKYHRSQRPMIKLDKTTKEIEGISEKPYLAASVEDLSQLKPLLSCSFVDYIYIDAGAFCRNDAVTKISETAALVQREGKKLYYVMPAIFRMETAKWYQQNQAIFTSGWLDGVVVKNYEELEFLGSIKAAKPVILADSSLYVWSQEGKAALQKLGADRFTLPLELNSRELKSRSFSGGEMILYGYLPLMVSAQCIVKNVGQCQKKSGLTYLKDRYGKEFPVKNQCEDCYNVIYNTTPLALFHQYEEILKIKPQGIRLAFTSESTKQIERTLAYYETAFIQAEKIDMEQYIKDFTNGHLKRGVE